MCCADPGFRDRNISQLQVRYWSGRTYFEHRRFEVLLAGTKSSVIDGSIAVEYCIQTGSHRAGVLLEPSADKLSRHAVWTTHSPQCSMQGMTDGVVMTESVKIGVSLSTKQPIYWLTLALSRRTYPPPAWFEKVRTASFRVPAIEELGRLKSRELRRTSWLLQYRLARS